MIAVIAVNITVEIKIEPVIAAFTKMAVIAVTVVEGLFDNVTKDMAWDGWGWMERELNRHISAELGATYNWCIISTRRVVVDGTTILSNIVSERARVNERVSATQ